MKFSNLALVVALSLGGVQVEGFSPSSLPQSRVRTALCSSFGRNYGQNRNPMDAYQRAMQDMNGGGGGMGYDPNGQYMTRSRSDPGPPGMTQMGATTVQSLVPDQDDQSVKVNSIFVPNQNPIQGMGGIPGQEERMFMQQQYNYREKAAQPQVKGSPRARSPRPQYTMFGGQQQRGPPPPPPGPPRNNGQRWALPQGGPRNNRVIPDLEPPMRARYGSNADRISERNRAIADRNDNIRSIRDRNRESHSRNRTPRDRGIVMEVDPSSGTYAPRDANYSPARGRSNHRGPPPNGSNHNPFRSGSNNPRRIRDDNEQIGARTTSSSSLPRRRYGPSSNPGGVDPMMRRSSPPPPMVSLESNNPLNVDGYTASGTLGGQTIGGRDNRLIGERGGGSNFDARYSVAPPSKFV